MDSHVSWLPLLRCGEAGSPYSRNEQRRRLVHPQNRTVVKEVSMAKDNSLSENELIEQARQAFPEDEITDLLEACEAFYMNGFADQVSGDVESPHGHFYRVHRWIITTDNYGFHDIYTLDDEDEAIRVFESWEKTYDEWLGDDDDAS